MNAAQILYFVLRNKCFLMAKIFRFESHIMRIHNSRFPQHFFFILAIISLSLECDSRLSQWLWDNDSVRPDGTMWSLKLMPKPCQLNSGKQQKLGAISCSLRKWAGPLNRHTGSFKSIFSLFICCPSHLLTWRVPLFDIYATWDS